ncbi:adenosine deaminase [soil metagenome]
MTYETGRDLPFPLDPLTASVTPGTWELLRRMPKAELHLHLDGSVRPETALELARERGIDGDLDLAGMRDLLVAPAQCVDQAELLRAFDLPIRLLQHPDALYRVTAELVEDIAAEGTVYAEIRWAPALHVNQELGFEDGIAAVVAGARAGMADHPEVLIRLIAVALRSHTPETSVVVAQAAARFLDHGLAGFDLAGGEEAFPDPLDHAEAFAIARQAGLGITVHAGEWGGADQVRRALAVHPQRIAHGTPAGDDPALQRKLIEHGVTLDLCPTSNVQAGIVPRLADHPLRRLLRYGVPVTLSTDDRTVSDLTLVREYARANGTLGLSVRELWQVNRHALEVAFLHRDEGERERLRTLFDKFADAEPALAR